MPGETAGCLLGGAPKGRGERAVRVPSCSRRHTHVAEHLLVPVPFPVGRGGGVHGRGLLRASAPCRSVHLNSPQLARLPAHFQ